MRAANSRFRSAIEQGDVEAALRADDELHGVLVAAAANRALTAVLDQFTPVAAPGRAAALLLTGGSGVARAARRADPALRRRRRRRGGGDRLRHLPQRADHRGVTGSLPRARPGSLCPRRTIPGRDRRFCSDGQAGNHVQANETIARDEEQARTAGLLLLGKGAVLAHGFDRPLAVEMDEYEQSACAAGLHETR